MEPVPTPPSTPCVLHQGYVDTQGYGIVRTGNRSRKAHVVAWEAECGPVPDGLVLDHLCRVRACVRVAHLEPVTPGVNTLRGMGACAVNARKVECPRGHAYTPENTRLTPRGQRQCRTCRRTESAARKARLRAEWRAQGVRRKY